jgi:hypothetical protein
MLWVSACGRFPLARMHALLSETILSQRALCSKQNRQEMLVPQRFHSRCVERKTVRFRSRVAARRGFAPRYTGQGGGGGGPPISVSEISKAKIQKVNDWLPRHGRAGPGGAPGPPLAGRNRPAVNLTKLLAMLRQVVAAVDDRVRHSGGGCTLSKQTPRPPAVASPMGHELP